MSTAQATATCYLIRDADQRAIPKSGVPYFIGFQIDEEGLNAARSWAAQNSTGRELAIVEMVDGEETREIARFNEGLEVA